MSTMATRALAEARLWLGTPYVHQASCQGAGCDCLGLVRGIWRALYGAEQEQIPPYSPDWDEPQGRDVLLDAAQRHFEGAGDAPISAGDVILFRMRDGAVAKHLGIVSQTGPGPRFIHAYTRHGVIESPLSAPWRRRIAAHFHWPEGGN